MPCAFCNSALCSNRRYGGPRSSYFFEDDVTGIRSDFEKSGQSRSAERMRRENPKGFTTLPKGVSELSSVLFITGVRRAGTYQLSASDRTISLHFRRTCLNLSCTSGPIRRCSRISAVGCGSTQLACSAVMIADFDWPHLLHHRSKVSVALL